MREKTEYAVQWNISAQYFYERGYYTWMAEKLSGYDTILEIGCGTGYSTLALVEKGYKVIAVDKNLECLNKARALLDEKDTNDDRIVFVEGDIVEENFRETLLHNYNFDAIICWNVGTYWTREMIQYYLPYMFEYGLNKEQIVSNPESSYSELIIWNVCRLAKEKNAAVHIIDRTLEEIAESTDPYYYLLKDEFDFSTIEYDNKRANSVSKGGRILSTNGAANLEEKMDILFVSILYR